MAAPQALRTNYADLVGSAMLPVLEEIFRSEYNMHAPKREQLGKVEKTDTSIWQYTEMHDMPLFSSVSEGSDYSMSRTKQGSDKTLSVVKYGLAASFSEELIEDSKFAHIADTVAKMAKSARESQEVAFMDLLNNGFSGTTTADGQALFASAHTTPTGTYTVRNKLSADSDLSVSSLKTMVSDFKKNFKGDSGIVYDIQPKFLVVPEELRLDAIQIVQSDLLSGTNNNDVNSLKGEGLQVLSSPHLSDADAWFLISAPADNGLRIVQRKPLETKASGPDVGFLNDAIYYKARYREIVAAVHGYGSFGTPGA
jgi:phage major head subunit gpT-like protein